MRRIYEDYIFLMQGVLNKQDVSKYKSKDYNALFEIAKQHNMTNMLYYALKDNEDVPEELKNELEKHHNLLVFKCVNQKIAQDSIDKMFNENKIKHMFMKGKFLRELYPSEDMREMSDVDVLVQKDDLEKVKDILVGAGYVFEGHKGNHDVYNKKPFISIEVHETMLHEGRETGLHEYLKNPWDKCLKENFKYTINLDDNYIFLMGHLLGHFQQGGIGVRAILDIGLFLRRYKTELNFEKIKDVFIEHNVLEVMTNIENLSEYWIGDGEKTELCDEMGEYVFESGSYGKVKNMMLYLADDGKGKASSVFKSLKRKLFLNPEEMKRRSKILEKYPILLPIGYVQRLFHVMFKQTEDFDGWVKNIKNADADSVKKHKEMLRRFGIDIK